MRLLDKNFGKGMVILTPIASIFFLAMGILDVVGMLFLINITLTGMAIILADKGDDR